MTYADAMSRFGSDKPDLRFGMEITDLADVFSSTAFKVFKNVIESGGAVKAINAKGCGGVPIRVIDEWTELAKEAGLGGLAYIRVQEDGNWKSPIVKFFSDEEKAGLEKELNMEVGDLVLFAADKLDLVHTTLGRLRLLAGEATDAIPQDAFVLTWVTEFPLFETAADGHLTPMHHPFTAPLVEDLDKLDSAPETVRAQAYDIILNGVELGGGSIRIHDPETQAKMFRVLRLPEEEIQDRFGHLLKALSFGGPATWWNRVGS